MSMGEMGKRPRKGGSRMERSHMMIRMVLMMALLSAPFPQPGLASDIPRAAERHRAELIRVSRAVWGVEAPVGIPVRLLRIRATWQSVRAEHESYISVLHGYQSHKRQYG